MRVLWVTLEVPDPSSFGRAGADARLLQAALPDHEVEVLTAALPEGSVELDLGSGRVPMSGVTWRLRRGFASPSTFPVHLVRSWPAHSWLYGERLRALRVGIAFHEERAPFDLVHFSGSELATLVDGCRAPTAVLAFDVLSRRHSDGHRLEKRRIVAWERRWLSRCDVLGAVSSEVASELRELTSRPVTVVPLQGPEASVGVAGWWAELTNAMPPHSMARSNDARRSAASTPARDPLQATIVVCTKDRPELLRRSLPLIAAQARRASAELLVVEQGATHTADLCRELDIAATVIHDDGVGAARARNIGVQNASGDIVLFTDDDCEVPERWVAEHLDALRDPSVVASCGVVHGLSRFGEADEHDPVDDPVARPARHSVGSPPWLIGHSSNMAVRRPVFLAEGGFDERFGPGSRGAFIGEDADLIVRLLGSGNVLAGTGAPVLHVDWRSPAETRRTLVAYERGSGAWIGKMLRAEPRRGMHFLRARTDLLRARLRFHSGLRSSPLTVLWSTGAFVHGLAFGARLRPWAPPSARTGGALAVPDLPRRGAGHP